MMSTYLFVFLRVAGECYRCCYYDIINQKRIPTTAELLAKKRKMKGGNEKKEKQGRTNKREICMWICMYVSTYV